MKTSRNWQPSPPEPPKYSLKSSNINVSYTVNIIYIAGHYLFRCWEQGQTSPFRFSTLVCLELLVLVDPDSWN